MKRALLAIVSTIAGLIMLLSFKTQSSTTSLSAPPAAVSTPSTSSSSSTSTSSGSGGSSTTGSSASASATPKTSTAETYTGTRYGPVQVAITVKNGTVTAVTAVEYPQNDPRDQQINSYAIPQLNSEAFIAKSAHIDMVSGATYTSTGYTTSLQSALDKAGL